MCTTLEVTETFILTQNDEKEVDLIPKTRFNLVKHVRFKGGDIRWRTKIGGHEVFAQWLPLAWN